jgi:hypothetical protein
MGLPCSHTSRMLDLGCYAPLHWISSFPQLSSVPLAPWRTMCCPNWFKVMGAWISIYRCGCQQRRAAKQLLQGEGMDENLVTCIACCFLLRIRQTSSEQRSQQPPFPLSSAVRSAHASWCSYAHASCSDHSASIVDFVMISSWLSQQFYPHSTTLANAWEDWSTTGGGVRVTQGTLFGSFFSLGLLFASIINRSFPMVFLWFIPEDPRIDGVSHGFTLLASLRPSSIPQPRWWMRVDWYWLHGSTGGSLGLPISSS